jgi:hypothetical protein
MASTPLTRAPTSPLSGAHAGAHRRRGDTCGVAVSSLHGGLALHQPVDRQDLATAYDQDVSRPDLRQWHVDEALRLAPMRLARRARDQGGELAASAAAGMALEDPGRPPMAALARRGDRSPPVVAWGSDGRARSRARRGVRGCSWQQVSSPCPRSRSPTRWPLATRPGRREPMRSPGTDDRKLVRRMQAGQEVLPNFANAASMRR